MIQPPIDELVYGHMFPKARPTDPPSFAAFLQRHLIYEVRQEVHSYYGHIDTQEAKYPGLDYNNPFHRNRLSRWQWHRRLFRAFDALRLTEWEIANLTKWEGTRWAKEKYEEEQGIVIRDTTADGFPDFTYPDKSRTEPESGYALSIEAVPEAEDAMPEARNEDEDEVMKEDEDETMSDEDEITTPTTVSPFTGYQSVVSESTLAIPLEDWLKTAIEIGQLELPHHYDSLSGEFSTPRIIAAAREGRWHDMPPNFRSFLQGRMRRYLGPYYDTLQPPARRFRYGTTAGQTRRTTSELRLAAATNSSQRVVR